MEPLRAFCSPFVPYRPDSPAPTLRTHSAGCRRPALRPSSRKRRDRPRLLLSLSDEPHPDPSASPNGDQPLPSQPANVNTNASEQPSTPANVQPQAASPPNPATTPNVPATPSTSVQPVCSTTDASQNPATPENLPQTAAAPPNDGNGGQDNDDNNNNSNNNGNNNGDDSSSDGPDDEPEQAHDLATTVRSPTPDKQTLAEKVQSSVSSASKTAAAVFNTVLTNVPAPVLVAIISMVSTMSAARYKADYDNQKAASAREAESRKHKEQVERDLREAYQKLSAPLLKSAAKLSERLRFMVEADWDTVEDAVPENATTKEGASTPPSTLSSTYSTYLLARFLSHVLILKSSHDLLDFGFPTADRILTNILGRIQGVLCANDSILAELQATEHFFKPPPNGKPLAAGPLKMSPRTQTVLGELMLRRRWSGRIDYVAAVEEKGGDPTVVTSPVLSFLEFSRLLNDRPIMQQYFEPVISQFTAMEAFSRATPLQGRARRDNRIGARLYFLQSALNDLLDFFDPLPNAKAIPIFQRVRVALGDATYDEEQRLPMSMRLLYRELAGFRDRRQIRCGAAERLRVPHEVEVFVTGAYDAGDPRVESAVQGNCPYSHRVMIALKEMGIRHKTVPIAMDSKPAWFYLLQPEASTPVIYHDGNVVMDAGNIVGYLIENFSGELASADHLKLAVGTAAFTRFHPHFVRWLGGDEKAKEEMAQELRKLDMVLREAQAKNGGKPFLGGPRFSREDTAIAPCLHNVEVAARLMKRWGLPNDLRAVWKYLHAARRCRSFKYSGAQDEAVVRRFRAIDAHNSRHSPMWPLAKMPE